MTFIVDLYYLMYIKLNSIDYCIYTVIRDLIQTANSSLLLYSKGTKEKLDKTLLALDFFMALEYCGSPVSYFTLSTMSLNSLRLSETDWFHSLFSYPPSNSLLSCSSKNPFKYNNTSLLHTSIDTETFAHLRLCTLSPVFLSVRVAMEGGFPCCHDNVRSLWSPLAT